MSARAVALRLARRDALRSRGRSALVVAMIALPVLGVGAADVLYRTFELSDEQHATRDMGRADGLLQDTGSVSVEQYPGRQAGWAGSNEQRSGPAPSPTSVLPSGTVVVPLHSQQVRVAAGGSVTVGQAHDLDLAAPLTQGMVRLEQGRPVRGADDVVLSTALADRLGVGVGDRVELTLGDSVMASRPGQTYPRGPAGARTVVGLALEPSSTGSRTAWVAPGQLTAPVVTWLVDLPAPLTWTEVRAANAAGFVLQPRGDVPGQPADPFPTGVGVDAEAVTAVSLVVGMTLLEVVLLAGPAFAVGAKRRTRDLALLSATGAEPRDVRRTVLAGGVVLGGVGGLLGGVLAVGLAAAALPLLTDFGDSLPGPFDVRPLELLALAVVGLLTATAAAVLPARVAAKQDVVAALTGRRGVVRSLRRTPVLGLLAAVAGTGLALYGARTTSVNTILAGSATAELGLVAMTPFLVGLVGRSSRFLPLGPRLALRDASRNRGRTAPAVSAVLAAVAGSVAVATYVASTDAYDRQQYTPSAPAGSAWVYLDPTTEASAPTVAKVLRDELPDARVTVVRTLLDYPMDAQSEDAFVTPRLACEGQADCTGGGGSVLGTLAVGDAQLVEDLSGVDVGAVRDVLRRGGAVVSPAFLQPDGTVVLDVRVQRPDRQETLRSVRVPAVAVEGDLQPTVLSPAAAAATGVPLRTAGVFAAGSTPTGAQEDRVRGELERAGIEYGVSVERGYDTAADLGLLALLLGSAVVVLGASGIATGLAAADGRADLATLAAVGASPRTRRNLAGFQSAVTAGLGTALGTVAGLVPAVAMIKALNTGRDAVAGFGTAVLGRPVELPEYPVVVPWANVLVTLLVVPALAALAAWLLTRSRLPLVARLS